MVASLKKRVELVQEIRPGHWRYNWHYYQGMAMNSQKRFIAMLAGSGGGKTIMGPAWLHKEIELRGPGDYIVGTSTNKLMRYTLLPEFLRLFKRRLDLGDYKKADQQFKYHDGSVNIFFFSAVNPESIESAHANAAWLDECGQQQFRQATWEAVQRRVGEKEGRILMTTTLYTMGWLRNEIYLPWEKGEDDDIDVIQFPSTANPNYSLKEFERQRKKLPAWKFKMFYLGEFDKPAGLIYDNFDDKKHIIKRFEIPIEWPRYVGVDFGSKNTAALWYAMNPHTGEFFMYREYLQAGDYAKRHVSRWKELSKGEWIFKCAGGSHQEMGWRDAFSQAGWPISEPLISEVDVGIDAVYEMHQEDRIYVFEDCRGYIDDKMTYSWALDDNYEPVHGKIDRKSSFHYMDCLVGDSLISTNKGMRRLNKIKVGDLILTREGYKKVINKFEKIDETYEARFSNGMYLRGTGKHRIFVKNKGFIPLDTVRYNDIIETWRENYISTKGRIISDTLMLGAKQTGHILGRIASYYIVLFMKMLMVKFLQDSIYIIGMAILLIMNCQILKHYMGLTTKEVMVVDTLAKNNCGTCEFSPLGGTNHQRVENGIANTQKVYGKIWNQLKKYANNVLKSMKQLSRGIVVFAQTPVNPHFAEILVLMMKFELVQYAKSSLYVINILVKRHVPENAVRCIGVSISKPTKVYDLTISDVHEYYANGILVHNCERYIMSLINRKSNMGQRKLITVQNFV